MDEVKKVLKESAEEFKDFFSEIDSKVEDLKMMPFIGGKIQEAMGDKSVSHIIFNGIANLSEENLSKIISLADRIVKANAN